MAQPELGLSKLCRLANRDKATTYRHLKVLEDAGFLEQSPLSKQYRLGPALLILLLALSHMLHKRRYHHGLDIFAHLVIDSDLQVLAHGIFPIQMFADPP